jgi:hypothetical protein
MKRYFFTEKTISNYWRIRIIQRGVWFNLPEYSVKSVTTNPYHTVRIAEGIWKSKVARALYA